MTLRKTLSIKDVEATLEQSINDSEIARLDGMRNMFVFEHSKIDAYKAEADRLLKKHGADHSMVAGAEARLANSRQFAGELRSHISAAETAGAASRKKAASKKPKKASAKVVKPVVTKATEKKPDK